MLRHTAVRNSDHTQDKIREYKVFGACSMHGAHEKYIRDFEQTAWRETTWNIQV
jgi:hypothetical protein